MIAGTTGESPTLTHDEQIELVRTVCQAVPVPVLAGAGSNDTRAAVELTERASEAGAAGILSVTPYYNRPSQAGLLAHYRAIAAATDLPVMLYDIPVRTGRKVDTATLLELAHDVANIVGVKDAAGNPAETALAPRAGARRLRGLLRRRRAERCPCSRSAPSASSASRRTGPPARCGEMIDAFEQRRRRAGPSRSTPA